MEHGSLNDPSKATFSFVDEDHTLANSVRFCLNQESVPFKLLPIALKKSLLLLCDELTRMRYCCSPRVSVCGYSIPHPSDARVNIRIQTTGDPAREVLKDGCQNLMLMCQHVRGALDKAVADFRMDNPTKMETKSDSE
ncbi:unnamed protein product [Linum tenue]|uniref:DNA-directed RNA polymerase RBP11-like dimerisation domain-containing protein n=1 Tax=Linum tenue TaxID=586396 RepID=A0AAV0I5R2_9ROSI|nr:unnamed protein product [Linum tenue]